MAAQVRHRAVSEVPPSIPLRAGEVDFIVRAVRSRADPQVPVHVIRRGRFPFRSLLNRNDVAVGRGVLRALPSPIATDPHVNFRDLADRACLDQLNDPSVVRHSVNLSSHLSHDTGLCRCLGDEPRLMHVMSQRLFAINVFASFESGHRRERVSVLGRADNDTVDVVHFFVELSEVGKCPGR